MTPRPSNNPSARRRSGVRPGLILGTAFALVAAWLLLVTTPGSRDRERAFTAAADCPAPVRGDADCLRTVTAVIDRTERVTRSKSPSYWLYITEADGTSTRTRIDGSPRQYPVARPGEGVEVTYWQGQIRYVDFASERRPTNADPRGAYRIPLTLGLGLGIYGSAFLAGAAAMAWTMRRSVRAYSWQVGLTITGGTFLAAFGALAPWLTDGIGEALQLTGLAAVVVLAVCALAVPFLRRRNRGDDTIALKPSVLTGEVCFPGVIMGEVPYAGSAGYLAAAPGVLATTPDPTGVFHRKAAPRTLTPLRVRPPYLTDPPGRPDYDGRAVVLECEDNGVPVLVVTRRKDAPAVLGALGPVPAE
ncbi:hypothetical protein ACIQPT_14120 [Streptomyces sp. NPDC091289]|uniref:hypothetical protein n=1 Tax=Streptomyces sp. NPDC091289 TaxID=3365989 RepID=UPI0038184650